jgi:hypothetical protein
VYAKLIHNFAYNKVHKKFDLCQSTKLTALRWDTVGIDVCAFTFWELRSLLSLIENCGWLLYIFWRLRVPISARGQKTNYMTDVYSGSSKALKGYVQIRILWFPTRSFSIQCSLIIPSNRSHIYLLRTVPLYNPYLYKQNILLVFLKASLSHK